MFKEAHRKKQTVFVFEIEPPREDILMPAAQPRDDVTQIILPS